MKQSAKSAILKAFGQAVRARRVELKLSQEELADSCRLDRTYIGGVERGERNLGLLNIHRIADALDIGAAALLKLAERTGKE